jgi:hypothetical protein
MVEVKLKDLKKKNQGGLKKMLSIQGIYKNGKIKLLEHMPKQGRFDIIVTFLDDRKKRLSKRTIWRDYYLILMKMISMKFWNVIITEGRIGS